MHFKIINTINVKATTSKILALFSVILMTCLGKSYAQTYDVYIANDVLTSPTTMEFDVYIKSNGVTTDWPLRTYQGSYTLDSTFQNGGQLSASYKASSTDFPSMNFAIWQRGATAGKVVLYHAVNLGVACPGFTIGTTALRLYTVVVTNTVPFGCIAHNVSVKRSGAGSLNLAITKWTACPSTTNADVTPGATSSSAATNTLYSLVRNMKPTTTNPVSPAAACAGAGSAQFTVTGGSNGTASALSYQWLENGSPLSNEGSYSGVTTNTLTITAPSSSLNGRSYSCVVSQCSPALTATSTGASLTVTTTSAPTGSASQSFCNAGTVGDLTATGSNIQWYDAASGGTLLSGSTSLANGSHYYASQTVGGCESTSRLDVTVTVNAPSAPTGSASQSFCANASPTVASLSASGTGIQWYDAASGGSLLSGSTALVNGSHYYASQTSGGCESASRLDVTVTLNNVPSVAGITGSSSVSTGGTTQLSNTTPGGSWTSDNESVATVDNTGLVTGVATGSTIINYCVTNGCGTTCVTHAISVASGCNYTVGATISGPAVTCAYTTATGGQTAVYSITATDATVYMWSVPLGAVGLTGQGTNTISFKYPTTFVSGSVSVEVGNGCGGDNITRTLNVSKVLPLPGAITGPLNACPYIGGAPVTYFITPVPGAVTHHWTMPTTGATIVSANADSSSIQVSFTSAIITSAVKAIKVKGISGLACGNSTDKSLTIAVAMPRTPGSITGVYSGTGTIYTKPVINACPYIGAPTQATYVIRKVANATSYNWTMPVGATATHPNGAGENDTLITVSYDNNFAAIDTIKVSASSPCGTSLNKNLIVKRLAIKVPGTITGPLNVCPLMEGSTEPAGLDTVYWIRRVVDVTSYIWTVPSGATIVSHLGTGANDTAIRVHFDATYTTGSITVQSVNGCATSAPKVLAIKRLLPATPGTISGPTDPCPTIGGNAVYGIGMLPANATSVLWEAPAGASIVGSATGLSVQIAYTSSFTTGAVKVYGVNNCSVSLPRSLTIVRKLPATPGTITVATVVATCPNKEYTYTIAAMPAYATSVTWEVPAGAFIVSGQNTLSIDVVYPGNGVAYMGAVKVAGINACDTGLFKSLTVNIAACAPAFAGGTVKPQQPQSAPIVKGVQVLASESKALNVKVYPNPSVNSFKLQVQAPGKEQMQVRVMDMQGREYKRLEMMPGETLTLGSELKAGSYMVEVRQGSEVKTTRVIKL